MKLISLTVMLLIALFATLNVKSIHAQATPTPTPTPSDCRKAITLSKPVFIPR